MMWKRHDKVFLLATAVVSLATAAAHAQVASAVIKEGDALDSAGLPGHIISAVDTPSVNAIQGWGVGVASSDGGSTLDSVLGSIDGVMPPMIFVTETTVGPLVQTSFETRTGISNTGMACYSASGNGGPDGSFDSCFVDLTPIAVEGDPLPPGPLDTLFWSFASAPTISGTGTPFFVGGTRTTVGGSTSARGLFTDANDALLYSGRTPDGLPAPLDDSGSPVGFDYGVSANGNQYLAEVEMETTGTDVPTTADTALVLSGAGLTIDGLLVQEGTPIPASANPLPGENWDNFDYNGVNEFLEYIFTGDTDGDFNLDEFVAVNGAIVLREEDMLGSFLVDGSIEAASINESGDWAVIWDVDAGGTREALIFNGEVVFVEGEAVDIDNDGVIDAGWLLTDFNGLSGGVKVGNRAADGEVDIYFEADADSSGFEIEGLFRLSLPTTPGLDGDLELKVIDAPDPVITIGDPISYNVLVRNNGSATATGVVVTSTLPATVVFNAAASDPIAVFNPAFGPGGTVTANLGMVAANEVVSYTFVVDTTVPGDVNVTSVLTANEVDPIPADNESDNNTFVGLITDLEIAIADAPDPVLEPGVPVIYSVTATNNGPSNATGVVVTVNLDPTTTFNAGLSDPIAMHAAGVVTANVGPLANGASSSFDIAVDTTVQGLLLADGEITGNQEDPILDNNTTGVETLYERSADLSVTVADAPDPVLPAGGNVTYDLEVTNGGPSIAVGTVASFLLDDRTAFVSATNGAVHDGSPTGGLVMLPLGDLADGGTGGFSVVAQTLEAGRLVAVGAAGADSVVTDPDPEDNFGAVNTLALDDLGLLPVGVFSNITSSGTSDVPGVPGAKFGTGVNRPFVGADGKTWILTADTDLGSSMDEVIIVGDLCGANTVVQEGVTMLPEGDLVGLIDDQLSLNAAGQFAFATNTDAATSMDEVIAKWDGTSFVTVAREGGFAAPTGFNYGSILGSPNIIFDNTVWFIADTDNSNTDEDVFVLKKNGNEVLFQEGVSIPMGQLGGTMDTWDNFDTTDLSVDVLGASHLVEGDTSGDTSMDDIAAVDNNVVLQEGFILPGSGFSSPTDAFSPIDYSRMMNNGDWFIRGGNDDNQDWLYRNGVVEATTGAPIAAGSPESYSDAPFSVTFFGFAGNSAGDYAIAGTTNAAEDNNNAVYVLNGTTVIAREDDPIDLDGNGVLDDGIRIRTFGNDDAILTDDLQFYTSCTLRAFNTGGNTDIGDGYVRYNLCGIAGPCGDLDNDKDVDGGDFALFLMAFATTPCDEAYHICADFDEDGLITQVDYQEWLQCYRAFTGNPVADPPAIPTMPDFDNDGDVDLADAAAFQHCAGAGVNTGFLCTLRFDYDRNEIVEAADFARFDTAFEGPQQ